MAKRKSVATKKLKKGPPKKRDLSAMDFSVTVGVIDGHYECRFPYFEALHAITRQPNRDHMPTFLRKPHIYTLADLTDDEIDQLQSWCVCNATPGWSTGIGIMEAAELIVIEAVANGNIAPKPGVQLNANKPESDEGTFELRGDMASTDAIKQVLVTTGRRLISRNGGQDSPL